MPRYCNFLGRFLRRLYFWISWLFCLSDNWNIQLSPYFLSPLLEPSLLSSFPRQSGLKQRFHLALATIILFGIVRVCMFPLSLPTSDRKVSPHHTLFLETLLPPRVRGGDRYSRSPSMRCAIIVGGVYGPLVGYLVSRILPYFPIASLLVLTFVTDFQFDLYPPLPTA